MSLKTFLTVVAVAILFVFYDDRHLQEYYVTADIVDKHVTGGEEGTSYNVIYKERVTGKIFSNTNSRDVNYYYSVHIGEGRVFTRYKNKWNWNIFQLKRPKDE